MTISINIGGTVRPSSHSVIQAAVPSRANTAPNTFEATARKSTMLEVASVCATRLSVPAQSSRP